ncbi:MAG: efflux RND transporter periplasmic adaptor subunit [Candidatus Neomarinimicrobiota bacterium]
MKRIAPLNFVVPMLLGAALLGGSCGTKTDTAPKSEEQQQQQALYTCGMHPDVIQEGPGQCPICKMDLVPVRVSAIAPDPSHPQERASAGDGSSLQGEILYWRAPMDPTYISSQPGKSPMGMDLVPVYAGQEVMGAMVRINPVVQQNIGVRTAPVVRRDLTRTIRSLGRLDYDETRVAHVHTKFTGWIETTYANATGQRIRKGEPLLDIYSPQLVTAQQEFVDANLSLEKLAESASPATRRRLETILESTRTRLEYLDVSAEQISQLTRTGEVYKTMTIRSPFSGIVVDKQALDGMEVRPGMRLYTVADLSKIWVFADIYEYEAPWVEEGQDATMSLSYQPGSRYEGDVQYVYPYLDEKTRTIKVRLVFANPGLVLKPGMYAEVNIQSSPVRDVLAVPLEAVLFSGARNVAFVSLGEGRFAPRDVTIGIESGDGYYEVKSGLAQGEVVVTSGQFLIDSESRLQESIAKLLSVEQVRAGGAMDMTPAEEPDDHVH